jgi:hypothetical protein
MVPQCFFISNLICLQVSVAHNYINIHELSCNVMGIKSLNSHFFLSTVIISFFYIFYENKYIQHTSKVFFSLSQH